MTRSSLNAASPRSKASSLATRFNALLEPYRFNTSVRAAMLSDLTSRDTRSWHQTIFHVRGATERLSDSTDLLTFFVASSDVENFLVFTCNVRGAPRHDLSIDSEVCSQPKNRGISHITQTGTTIFQRTHKYVVCSDPDLPDKKARNHNSAGLICRVHTHPFGAWPWACGFSDSWRALYANHGGKMTRFTC